LKKIQNNELDEIFNPLYRDEGIFIFSDRKESESISTQIFVNSVSFGFDIPKIDFLRLARAMNYAIRAIKIDKMGVTK